MKNNSCKLKETILKYGYSLKHEYQLNELSKSDLLEVLREYPDLVKYCEWGVFDSE